MKARTGARAAALPLLSLIIAVTAAAAVAEEGTPMAGYDDLLTLFTDWRKFERPPMREGAPDYTSATLARKQAELKDYQARLAAIDPGAWPVAQRVDYEIVRAEMNGLDFDLRVLQPWARDPAYYHSLWTEQSDTPCLLYTSPSPRDS